MSESKTSLTREIPGLIDRVPTSPKDTIDETQPTSPTQSQSPTKSEVDRFVEGERESLQLQLEKQEEKVIDITKVDNGLEGPKVSIGSIEQL